MQLLEKESEDLNKQDKQILENILEDWIVVKS
jgi:hypothetical protein